MNFGQGRYCLEHVERKYSKVKEKQKDFLLKKEGLKTMIKHENGKKPSPEEFLSYQI